MGLRRSERLVGKSETLSWLVGWSAALLGGAGCGEAEPTLTQTPSAAVLTVRDAELVSRDASEATPHETGPTEDAEPPVDGGDDGSEVPADAGTTPDASTPGDAEPPADAVDSVSHDAKTCSSDDECEAHPTCGRAFCKDGFCDVEPIDTGAACDDDDPCTKNDACTAGRCRGLEPTDCNDNDPCTTDTCDPMSGCTHQRVACQADDNPCDLETCGAQGLCESIPDPAKPGGSPCDDANDATTGDMCLNGTCRGFELIRISGQLDLGSLQWQGLILTEVDHEPAGWSAIFWSSARTHHGGLAQKWSLATVTTPTAHTVVRNSVKHQAYTGLSDGYVIQNQKKIFGRGDLRWESSELWNDAIDPLDVESVTALVALEDLDASGNSTRKRLQLGGIDADGDGIAVDCESSWNRPGNQDGSCQKQALPLTTGTSATIVPTAVTAFQGCAGGQCTERWLAMAANAWEDFPNGPTWGKTYFRAGEATSWAAGWTDSTRNNGRAKAIGGWSWGTSSRILTVGSGGLLVYGEGENGSIQWSRIDGALEQAKRSFTGVAVAGDAVLVSASWGDNNETIYELWTLARSQDGKLISNWRIHELARGPSRDLSGLYDIDVDSNGKTLAVGAIHRSDGSDWLDGLVLQRAGD